ncbi:cupin domain-containing protein [Pseudomonas sp. M30-35]|uniref:cupin domain-containing protein n=1 Tax=Pseudomonas sp. M30-35 TaxID=1981174 RepID=UPI000B3C8E42|nr:cupin domain-containing protein [Pseudomonas sp. M30-35]ARU89284.1 hypothetical protein B9K09_15515 [Pseudomonas sp. M30-35]
MSTLNNIFLASLLAMLSTTALAHSPAGEEKLTSLVDATLPAQVWVNAKALHVQFAPGASAAPHTHPGPVFVVVVAGKVESSLDGGKVESYSVGDAWYEAPGQEHRVARNASQTEPAAVVAWLLSDGKTPLVKPLGVPAAR